MILSAEVGLRQIFQVPRKHDFLLLSPQFQAFWRLGGDSDVDLKNFGFCLFSVFISLTVQYAYKEVFESLMTQFASR